MKPSALERADSPLRVAKRALAELGMAYGNDEIADHWFVFLTAWKGIYRVLEQGAKVSAVEAVV